MQALTATAPIPETFKTSSTRLQTDELTSTTNPGCEPVTAGTCRSSRRFPRFPRLYNRYPVLASPETTQSLTYRPAALRR